MNDLKAENEILETDVNALRVKLYSILQAEANPDKKDAVGGGCVIG